MSWKNKRKLTVRLAGSKERVSIAADSSYLEQQGPGSLVCGDSDGLVSLATKVCLLSRATRQASAESEKRAIAPVFPVNAHAKQISILHSSSSTSHTLQATLHH